MFERCRRDAIEKLAPLKQSMKEQQTAMVQLLDQQFTSNKFTKIQQEKLTYLIVELCEELLCGDDNAELKAMYNQYTESDYDNEAAKEQGVANEFMKSMFEKEFGVDLDDDDIDLQNPQTTAERLAAKSNSWRPKQKRPQPLALNAKNPPNNWQKKPGSGRSC